MSTPLAHYSFLPWLRRGIGNLISENDALGVDPTGTMALERARMTVGITVGSTDITDGSLDNNDIQKTFQLLGPPDILAISTKAIVHVEPKPKVNNYEANGLPYIEFYEEDFLWAYTPAAAADGTNAGKLTPWLALICLKDDEFTLGSTSDGRTFVSIDSDAIAHVFHDETQHWAWGHVHLNTEMTTVALADQIDEVTTELAADADSGLCRLLCPRKLIKETGYTAFLIPAFETGRRAGLAEDYLGVYAQQMSWGLGEDYASKPRGYDYPVYYSWQFRTGLNGDFESLARLLKSMVMDPELGKRDMYIANAGYGLDSTTPESTVLGIEGALKPPSFTSDPWTVGSGDLAYQEHLRKLLNLSVDNETKVTDSPTVIADSLAQNPFFTANLGDDPMVTPEIFGRWHGLVTRLQQTGSANHPWVNQLNLDPRNRATAGLGTSVIKKHQEDYMRRAWQQVKQINEANQKIRKAALAGQINKSIFSKHIKPYESGAKLGSADKMIRMTRGMHGVLSFGTGVPNETITLYQTIAKSKVPNASQSASFAKLTRPGKKFNKLLNKNANAGAQLHEQVTQRFNDGAIETARLKLAPSLTISAATVGTVITTAVSQFLANDEAMASQGFFDAVLQETNFDNLNQAARKATLRDRIDANGQLNANAKALAKALIDSIASSVDGGTTTAHKIRAGQTEFEAVFGTDVQAKSYLNVVVDYDTNGAPGVIGRATSLADITAYQTLFDTFNTYQTTQLVGIPQAPAIAAAVINNLPGTITAALNQKQLMQSRISSSITVKMRDPLTKVITSHTIDKLRPIMAYPIYEDPMFRELKAISQEYILPNLSKVPINSITLLETNQAFIEAYMAGLNHEMSRELLWREFPTDQRGSYFRQFWDVSDDIFQDNPEMKLDIQKMHLWESNLGGHSPRVATNTSGTYLVLLIRGELLKKYPNTQVYAQKAVYVNPAVADTPRALADENDLANIKTPVFMAELDPDIYLFGFDLDKVEAKGDSSDTAKPGWFFVLRERPGQIRFGLDDWTPIPGEPAFPTSDPTDWNDLSWEHLVTTAADLNEYQIDVTHGLSAVPGTPTATWGRNAADMAFILYQNPVMYARHAQEMLPD
jgi:hypothetical protein